jgi:hypothetical protein
MRLGIEMRCDEISRGELPHRGTPTPGELPHRGYFRRLVPERKCEPDALPEVLAFAR